LPVILCLAPSVIQSQNLFAAEEDLTAENVVAEHPKSIGSPSAPAALKSRAFVGAASADFIQGGNGNMAGKSTFVSEGNKLAVALRFQDLRYPGKYFTSDGKDLHWGTRSCGEILTRNAWPFENRMSGSD
jgi:hypothetical protein